MKSSKSIHGDDSHPLDHPFNRLGYKYSWAKPWNPYNDSLNLSFKQLFDFNPNVGMALSSLDRNPLIQLSERSSVARGNKGWSSVKSTHAVKFGTWYYEVKILNGGNSNSDNAHCRVGWSRREAYLDWACGTDEFGYGYRDASGEIFHNAKPTPYGDAFKTGDVIGCLISLGSEPKSEKINSQLAKWPLRSRIDNDRVIIKYKGHAMYESRDYAHYDINTIRELQKMQDEEPVQKKRHKSLRTKNGFKVNKSKTDYQYTKEYYEQFNSLAQIYPLNESGIPVIEGSKMQFFKNGVCQGDAFVDLPVPISSAFLIPPNKRKPKEAYMPTPPVEDDGTLGYYPTISLFKGGQAKVNFTSTLEFPPQTDITYKLLTERLIERDVETLMSDILTVLDRHLATTLLLPSVDSIRHIAVE